MDSIASGYRTKGTEPAAAAICKEEPVARQDAAKALCSAARAAAARPSVRAAVSRAVVAATGAGFAAATSA